MLACDTKEIVIVWQRWAKTPQESLKCLEMWRLIEKIVTRAVGNWTSNFILMPRCCWGCDGTFPIFVSETHLQDNLNMRIYILMGCINSDGKLLMVFICRLLLLLWGVATAWSLKKNEPLTKTAKNGHKNRCHKNTDDSLSCGWTCNYRASPTTKTVEKAQFCIFCSSKRNSHNFQRVKGVERKNGASQMKPPEWPAN